MSHKSVEHVGRPLDETETDSKDMQYNFGNARKWIKYILFIMPNNKDCCVFLLFHSAFEISVHAPCIPQTTRNALLFWFWQDAKMQLVGGFEF